MAPDDRKVKCTTRLDALDVPRSSAHKAREFVGFRTLFSHLFVRGKIAWHPHTKVFLCIARFQRRFVDIIGGLYRWFFAGDTLVFTLGLIKYEPRWFGPTDKVVKIWLQDITVCDGIDALENLGIIVLHVHVAVSFAKYGTLTALTIFGHKRGAHEFVKGNRSFWGYA